MQPRKSPRPQWYNPFTRKSAGVVQTPWFEGWLRAAPFHRWDLPQISHILELVSKEPGLFGFPARPTCVVNTTHMLPSARSRQSGITVFGTERGCKTVVVPPSCSRHPFDETDAKLLIPLLKWNPSVEMLFLSKSCEPIAPILGPYVKPMRNLTRIVLVDWEDPAMINKICMNAKHLDTLDTVCPDEASKNWANPYAVSACCELIEMHPRLRAVEATIDFLGAMNHAVELSRCKHNVALIAKWCRAARFYRAMWGIGMVVTFFWIGTAAVTFVRAQTDGEPHMVRDLSLLAMCMAIGVGLIVKDHMAFKETGRRWTYYVRYLVLLRRRFGTPTVTYDIRPTVPKAGKK